MRHRTLYFGALLLILDTERKSVMEINIEKTLENLEKNNIEAFYAENCDEAKKLLRKLISLGATVGIGGSVTLEQAGIIDLLKCGDYNFLDRTKGGLTRDEINEIFQKSMSADVYLSSTNALTEGGELYNVDGNANRISAIAFGPKNVIIVAGVNKIVENIDAAVKRVKTVAAPKNCVRLGKNTYCRAKGQCVCPDKGMGEGCDSPERICRQYLVTGKQAEKGRIKVVLVNENLGY